MNNDSPSVKLAQWCKEERTNAEGEQEYGNLEGSNGGIGDVKVRHDEEERRSKDGTYRNKCQ